MDETKQALTEALRNASDEKERADKGWSKVDALGKIINDLEEQLRTVCAQRDSNADELTRLKHGGGLEELRQTLKDEVNRIQAGNADLRRIDWLQSKVDENVTARPVVTAIGELRHGPTGFGSVRDAIDAAMDTDDLSMEDLVNERSLTTDPNHTQLLDNPLSDEERTELDPVQLVQQHFGHPMAEQRGRPVVVDGKPVEGLGIMDRLYDIGHAIRNAVGRCVIMVGGQPLRHMIQHEAIEALMIHEENKTLPIYIGRGDDGQVPKDSNAVQAQQRGAC